MGMRGSFMAKIAMLFSLGLASGSDLANARIKATTGYNGNHRTGVAVQKRAARKRRIARARASKRGG